VREYSARVPRRAPVLTLLALVCLVALAGAAGCGGDRTVVREESIEVRGGEQPAREGPSAPGGGAGRGPSGAVQITVVTHGQASSPFWAIVRNGVEAAARQMDVLVSYRAPDIYSLARMQTLIEQAVARRPDGLVVSLPEPDLLPAVRRATRSGVPVVSINSGSDVFGKLGILAHVGQPEDRAGLGAGERLAEAGARRVLCVNLVERNRGLDARCAGMAHAMRRVGGTSRVIRVNDQAPETPRRIARAIARYGSDGVLTLNATSGRLALEAADRLGGNSSVKIGTFDLNPDVLDAVRRGRLLFAVDQQPYLQGYLPVVLLTQRARYGLFPAEGDIVATGPNFVTKENAAKAIELSRRSIR
jgi:simple sugar transport system substrate-binding protein